MAGRVGTLVDIDLTIGSSEARSTSAAVVGNGIMADTTILTGRGETVILVLLAPRASKAQRTQASESVDQITAVATVQAGVVGAFIDIDLTLGSRESLHTDTSIAALLVQTSSIILARRGFALVDVDLTSGSSKASRTGTLERARYIHTGATVLTGRSGVLAFIDILRAVDTFEARRTGAGSRAIEWRCITDGASLAGIRGTCILQMTQNPDAARRTLAMIAADSIMAGRARMAGCMLAVVNILRTVGSSPAIHTDTIEATVGIDTGSTILAYIWPQRALVNVARAIGARILGRTLAGIAGDAVDTGGVIFTQMRGTVVYISLTICAIVAFRAYTGIGFLVQISHTSAAVLAGRRTTGSSGIVVAILIGSEWPTRDTGHQY